MRFLVDAHLPPSLCAVLARHGHNANHTLDVPAKNATKDAVLNRFRSMNSVSLSPKIPISSIPISF
jgi:predicted nuclease of predicted toxin-antitoxin system